MKICSMKNTPSFGRVIVEDDKATKSQKVLIKSIMKNKNLTKELIKDLEKKDTDIYITSEDDGETVTLNLYTCIDYFDIKVVPYDDQYNSPIMTQLNPSKNGQLVTNLAIYNFFQRANNLDLGSEKNIKAFEKAMDIK